MRRAAKTLAPEHPAQPAEPTPAYAYLAPAKSSYVNVQTTGATAAACYCGSWEDHF